MFIVPKLMVVPATKPDCGLHSPKIAVRSVPVVFPPVPAKKSYVMLLTAETFVKDSPRVPFELKVIALPE